MKTLYTFKGLRTAQQITEDNLPMYLAMKERAYKYMKSLPAGTKLNNHKVTVALNEKPATIRVALEMLVEDGRMFVNAGARGTLYYFIPSAAQRRMKAELMASREDRPAFRSQPYNPAATPGFNQMMERVQDARTGIKSKF